MKLSAIAKMTAVSTAIVLVLLSGTAHSQVFRGHYELSVTWGSSASRVTTSYEVMPGQTIQAPTGEGTVSITVLPLSDREYDVQIAVWPTTETSLSSPVANQSRRSPFDVPFDLAAGSSGLPSGVIVSVSRLLE